MKEAALSKAIQKFRDQIEQKDYAKLGAKGNYLTVPYRLKFVRDYFGERMSIQTESTELSNGFHKFKANIYIDEKLVSVGESKQMKNADKEFEKQQTVSIGRGLSILGFFGDELATAEEMEQFLKPQKPNVVPIKPIAKFNADEFVKEWIEKMTQTADNATSQNIFEKNMQVFRQEYQTELQQISIDLMQQAKIEGVENTLKKQITDRRK